MMAIQEKDPVMKKNQLILAPKSQLCTSLPMSEFLYSLWQLEMSYDGSV
jgi:hypothetical protein